MKRLGVMVVWATAWLLAVPVVCPSLGQVPGAADRVEGVPEAIPEDGIGLWRFDPGPGWERDGLHPSLIALRAAIGAGLLTDPDALLSAKILLALAQVGEHPHRLVVLGFEARPVDARGGMVLERLEAVLEIRTSRSHLGLVSTLQALLLPPGGTSRQRLRVTAGVDGKAGVEVAEFVRSDLPEWAVFAWASEPGVFTVSFGRGAMERWIARRGFDGKTPRGLSAMRREPGPRGRRVFEAWVDLNALRRGFPEAFDESRSLRIFDAIGIDHAREVGVLARRLGGGPGPVSLDWLVSSRSDPPGRWWSERLADGSDPIAAEASGGGGRADVLVFKNRLTRLEEVASAVFLGALRWESHVGQRVRRRRWLARHGGALAELERSLNDRVVLAVDGSGPVRLPGIGVVRVGLGPGVRSERVDSLLDRMLSSFSPVLRKDRKSGLWSIVPLGPDRDPTGLLRIGAMGVVEVGGRPAVVAGWSESALSGL
ncbi:MAG: hypothetical protein AAF108_03160 [Planctomycetota bacterium]